MSSIPASGVGLKALERISSKKGNLNCDFKPLNLTQKTEATNKNNEKERVIILKTVDSFPYKEL